MRGLDSSRVDAVVPRRLSLDGCQTPGPRPPTGTLSSAFPGLGTGYTATALLPGRPAQCWGALSMEAVVKEPPLVSTVLVAGTPLLPSGQAPGPCS